MLFELFWAAFSETFATRKKTAASYIQCKHTNNVSHMMVLNCNLMYYNIQFQHGAPLRSAASTAKFNALFALKSLSEQRDLECHTKYHVSIPKITTGVKTMRYIWTSKRRFATDVNITAIDRIKFNKCTVKCLRMIG